MLGSARSVLLKKAAPSDALPASALALYSFSENTGTTTADVSGNNHTATFGSATWATGHTGTGIQNTTTNIGAKSVFTSPYDVLTIMGWIKPLDLASGSSRAAFGFFDNGEATGFAIFAQRNSFGNPNVLQADVRIGATLYPLHGPALTVGTWTHVAMTYDATTAILYKDGVAVDSITGTGNIGQGDALCMIGGMFDGSFGSQCIIDDVRVYHAALTPGQVVTGMNTPVA